jgi:hypothetical protein
MSIRFKPRRRLPPSRPLVPALLGLLLLAAGCGTVSNDSLGIQSRPEGAFVYVNGKFVGNSPVDVRLNRQVPHRVEVRKAGFVSETVTVYPSFSDSKKPTVIFGPLREAGYYRDLQPNPVEATLLYEGLEGMPGDLTRAQADRLLARIAEEEENGEFSATEAALARAQVEERVE